MVEKGAEQTVEGTAGGDPATAKEEDMGRWFGPMVGVWILAGAISPLLAQEAGVGAEAAATADAATTVSLPPAGVATETTRLANEAVAARLPLDDPKDLEDATRGLLGQIEEKAITNPDGSVAWTPSRYDFIDGKAPDTVNPSLWRQSRLNRIHGLFEVADGIYQLRGYDISVMTLIRGNTGWIVVDPMTSPAPSKAAFALAQKILGERPITGLLFTHSHADHFGGVRGIVSEAELAARPIPILAPAGFTEESVSENVMAGNAMGRRAIFQFGALLPSDAAGNVGTGLGQTLSVGPIGFVRPTEEIADGGAWREIDGVTFVFINAGGTEAPAEFMFYLPQFKALCAAEVVTKTFHNVLTPRGAKVRDALKWSKVIDEALVRYGAEVEVMFASHNWPTWGNEDIRTTLLHHRDKYRFLHDQTLRLANQGETLIEIAEALGEPDFAATDFSVRGYYGTMNHNSKAVYQNYFGWWDGVPAHLYALPPVEESRHYVEFMGGAEAALEKAKVSFGKGEYRWAATVLNHLVFADPGNEAAKQWLAAAYEQLGFQSESGAWRNYFLTGAMELRKGAPKLPPIQTGNRDFLSSIPTETLFDAMAVRFNPSKMRREPFVVAFEFTDTKEHVTVDVGRNVAFPRMETAEKPTVKLTLTRRDFDLLLLRETNPNELTANGRLVMTGDTTASLAFLLALDQFPFGFNVVTP